MIVFLVVPLIFLCFLACAICGNLSRIADAIEAQNRAYGVAEQEAASMSEAA